MLNLHSYASVLGHTVRVLPGPGSSSSSVSGMNVQVPILGGPKGSRWLGLESTTFQLAVGEPDLVIHTKFPLQTRPWGSPVLTLTLDTGRIVLG